MKRVSVQLLKKHFLVKIIREKLISLDAIKLVLHFFEEYKR